MHTAEGRRTDSLEIHCGEPQLPVYLACALAEWKHSSGVKLKHWRIHIILSEDIGRSVQALSAVHVSCVLGKSLSILALL